MLTLTIGLLFNLALGGAKLAAGIISHSTAVFSDAFNNISDAATSVVTVVATALSARAADHDHPYGHGRYEYIATFILGAVILAVGIEVFISGIERAITPEPVTFDSLLLGVLISSIAVKLFMGVFYLFRTRGGGSDTVKAAAVDSFTDSAVTSVVLVCAVIERYTGAHIDGYVSIAISLVIAVSAIKILKSTIDRLLGGRPDGKLVADIEEIIKSVDGAISSHDLIINDYGSDTKIGEVDLVFPAESSFIDVHNACDYLEHAVAEKTGVKLSVHADPYITDDPRLVELRELLEKTLGPFGATAHDVAVVDCNKTVELDIALTKDVSPRDVTDKALAAVKTVLPDYEATIAIDHV